MPGVEDGAAHQVGRETGMPSGRESGLMCSTVQWFCQILGSRIGRGGEPWSWTGSMADSEAAA